MPPKRPSDDYHLLPGDATPEEISALVKAIKGDETTGSPTDTPVPQQCTPPSRCRSYGPGHHVHHIQARNATNDHEHPFEPVVVTEVGPDTVALRFRDGQVHRYANHSLKKIKATVKKLGADAMASTHWGILRFEIGDEWPLFSLAGLDESLPPDSHASDPLPDVEQSEGVRRREHWESDCETAGSLAKTIAADSGSTPPQRQVDAILELFGMSEFTDTERNRLARAFFTVGIEADPPPDAMLGGQTTQLTLNPRGQGQISSGEMTASWSGKRTSIIGHLVLRPYGPNAIHDDHAVVFINGSGAEITRLDVASWMFAGTVTSSTSHKTFEDIEDGGTVELERAPGWDDDYVVSFSLTLTLSDGSTLTGGASFSKMATAWSPREYVAALDAEGVVENVTRSE